MDAAAPTPGTKSFQKRLAEIYGKAEAAVQVKRYRDLADRASQAFGGVPRFFSAPGRTELGGNHTDHNRGRVLCAAATLDMAAAVVPSEGPEVELWSDGWDRPFRVDLARLEPDETERGSTEALIRGVAEGFADAGYRTGGFRGILNSRVPTGSGLSSSAALEVLLGTILSGLYNEGGIRPEELARIGQRAENRHFGKPCGLMDQTASAVGGVLLIDFENPASPRTRKIKADFEKEGYALAVVATGGSHSDLTEEYAAIPREMREAASVFGKETLRGLELGQLLRKLPEIRAAAGDRAALRALHFIEENDRVLAMGKALEDGRMKRFLKLADRSGSSSWRYLQNVQAPGDPRSQALALALALTEFSLRKRGACRVHGGGFEGTIQAFVPLDGFKEYREIMEHVLGPGCVTRLRIREEGAGEIR